MRLRNWQAATLLLATVTMGLTAGVFGVYAHSIMRGLTKTDDRTFVGAFQAIDRAIINPLFMLTFMGVLVLTGVAGVLNLRSDARSVLPWVAVAFGLYLVVVVITVALHVPLNDDIEAAATPTPSPMWPRCVTPSTRPDGSPGTWFGRSPPRPRSSVSPGLVLHGPATYDDEEAHPAIAAHEVQTRDSLS